MVQDQLAGKEMTIGRFYLRNGDPIAAIGRFRTVVDNYQTTSHAPEALYRLIAAYLSLGLTHEAIENGAVLGYNYPGDYWYREPTACSRPRGCGPACPPSPDARPEPRLLPFGRHKETDPRAASGHRGRRRAPGRGRRQRQSRSATIAGAQAEEARIPARRAGALSF